MLANTTNKNSLNKIQKNTDELRRVLSCMRNMMFWRCCRAGFCVLFVVMRCDR